jgi:hypothetical protein
MPNRRAFLLTLPGLSAGLIIRDALADDLTGRRGFPHPDPRPGITGAVVLAESELGGKRSVLTAYAAARTYPDVFDGVFCACRCDKNMNHRSLLSCFEGRQPIGCRACREQAEFIVRLVRTGSSLQEIRAAVDKEYDG